MIDPNTILQSATLHCVMDWILVGSIGAFLLMLGANLIYGMLVCIGLGLIGIQELKVYMRKRKSCNHKA